MASNNPQLRQLLRYRIDNALSHGITILMLWVVGALFLVIIAVGILTWILGIGPMDSSVSFTEAIWLAMTRSLDPGTFGADSGHRFRLAMLVITLFGVFAVATIIGLVSNAIDRRLDELRRGKSLVIEEGHSLILGFSAKLPIVIRELIEANESNKNHAIVVLSTEDKVDLDELLRREVKDRRTSRIIVRRGEPASIGDLLQARPEKAKSVVILRPDEDAADAEVVKVAMAVLRVRRGMEPIPIVAEFDQGSTARAVRQAMPGQIATVVSKEVVARIAAQTSRGSGLGTVYQELLDFAGDEFYLADPPPQWVGRTFGEAMLSSSNSTLVGLEGPGGNAQLCPDFSQEIAEDDQLVFLAQDDSELSFDLNVEEWKPQANRKVLSSHARVESTLILGWNPVAARILEEIDHHVLPGSYVHVVADEWIEHDEMQPCIDGLRKLRVTTEFGDTIDADIVGRALSMGPFDHVMVLCAHHQITAMQSDSRALLTLMHIRNYLSEHEPAGSSHRTNVVTEVLDSQAVELAEVAMPDDFIVSQRLVSLLIAQLAETPDLKAVLHDILDSQGCQVMILSAIELGIQGSFDFRELVMLTRELGFVLLGWRLPDEQATGGLPGGIRMNPAKSERVVLRPQDSLIGLVRH